MYIVVVKDQFISVTQHHVQPQMSQWLAQTNSINSLLPISKMETFPHSHIRSFISLTLQPLISEVKHNNHLITIQRSQGKPLVQGWHS